jgi:hypothetical protein
MSTLTKQERDGLEEVFLSIHLENRRYQIAQYENKSIIFNNAKKVFTTLAKETYNTLKKPKKANFLSFFYKKKKSLSK